MIHSRSYSGCGTLNGLEVNSHNPLQREFIVQSRGSLSLEARESMIVYLFFPLQEQTPNSAPTSATFVEQKDSAPQRPTPLFDVSLYRRPTTTAWVPWRVLMIGNVCLDLINVCPTYPQEDTEVPIRKQIKGALGGLLICVCGREC